MKISDRVTSVDLTLRNPGGGNEVHVNIAIVDNFETACGGLAGYLNHFSHDINDVFPTSTGKPGEIRLDTDPDSPNLIAAWVYHNVFVCAKLFESEHNESMISTKLQSCRTSFYGVVNTIFQRIQDGSIQNKAEVTMPNIVNVVPPDSIKTEKTFEVEVVVDMLCYHDVKCSGVSH